MKELQNKIIYQVFVRDYTKEGTLKALEERLDEVFASGGDILYLMPIYPIGKIGRKGKYGSPYAVQDYRKIDPSIGTFEDLHSLIEKVHERKKKIILDVVFNHTSRDSVLLKEHEEYFYHDEKGNVSNKVADWSDVYDLNHDVPELEEYLSDTLKFYEDMGIDGFRFDVASLIKPSFYKLARTKLKKETLFFGECVDTALILYLREKGFSAYSNEELYEGGVDLFYPYSFFQPIEEYLLTRKKESLEVFKYAYNLSLASLSNDALITMALENHDRRRLASYDKDESFRRSLLLLTFFSKGPAFVYAGEEYKATITPSLFEKEDIPHTIQDQEYYDFYQKLVSLKHRKENLDILESIILKSNEESILFKNTFSDKKEEYALINFSKEEMKFPLGNGIYQDLISHKIYSVTEKALHTKMPLWLRKID